MSTLKCLLHIHIKKTFSHCGIDASMHLEHVGFPQQTQNTIQFNFRIELFDCLWMAFLSWNI